MSPAITSATADITLLNLNMLYLKYFERVDRELHVPLGPLYLTRAIEDAGYRVDFRDYQFNEYDDPFDVDNCIEFLNESASIIGISVMANLLPFAILLAKGIKQVWPEKIVVLGGVGPKAVEAKILARFPEVDLIAYGEGEMTGPAIVECLTHGSSRGNGTDGNGHQSLPSPAQLRSCPGIVYRDGSRIVKTEHCGRIENLAGRPYPAYEKTDLTRYSGIGLMTSRGCPFKCSFCSVAPVWDFQPVLRTADDIIGEMRYVLERSQTDLFLFQDEYFLASPQRAKAFSRALIDSGLKVRWKAFGRVNLTDKESMELMAKSGCLELRFGIESGCDEVLQRVQKGFSVAEATDVVSQATDIFPGVDTFFIWGFPFETMPQFYQSVFLMNSYRMMGVRVLPSLLCYLPQTEIYENLDKERLEFSPEMIPEYMVTGHETCSGSTISVDSEHLHIYRFIVRNRDIFPGFFHYDIENNVRPKLAVLTEFGFYGNRHEEEPTESCGAHSTSDRGIVNHATGAITRAT